MAGVKSKLIFSPRFKIDTDLGGVGLWCREIILQIGPIAVLGRWRQVRHFGTVEEAKTYYATVKHLPEYLP